MSMMCQLPSKCLKSGWEEKTQMQGNLRQTTTIPTTKYIQCGGFCQSLEKMQGFKASQEDVMEMGYVLSLERGLGLGSASSSCPLAT